MPDLSHSIAFKAVEGAVRNALDGHPSWEVPVNFARSVAKRAAGTLMAHAGPSLLASARRSGQRRRLRLDAGSKGGGAPKPRLLLQMQSHLNILIAIAHKSGDHGRYIELVTAARIIKREIQRNEQTAATAPDPQSSDRSLNPGKSSSD